MRLIDVNMRDVYHSKHGVWEPRDESLQQGLNLAWLV